MYRIWRMLRKSMSQIQFQVLNIINKITNNNNNNSKFTINKSNNAGISINFKKIIDLICFFSFIIIYLINFNFFVFVDYQEVALNFDQLNNTFNNTNNAIVFFTCPPKGITHAYFLKKWWFLIDLLFKISIPNLAIVITYLLIFHNIKKLIAKLTYLKDQQRNKLVLFNTEILSIYCCMSLISIYLTFYLPFVDPIYIGVFCTYNYFLNILISRRKEVSTCVNIAFYSGPEKLYKNFPLSLKMVL